MKTKKHSGKIIRNWDRLLSYIASRTTEFEYVLEARRFKKKQK